MLISSLYASQRKLKRKDKIPALMKSIDEKGLQEKVELQTDGNIVVIKNGHHRITALYLLGIKNLNKEHYILSEVDCLNTVSVPFIEFQNFIL